ARKSFTLVSVGPGISRSPSFSKNSVELLSFRKTAGSRPRRPARVRVVASTKAPAGSSGRPAPPSVPSVSPESAATPLVPASATASANAYSWLGPPRPWPRSVTVSSPPDRITARRPCALRSRASRACAAATSRASPSIAVPSRTHSYPAACAASSTARKTSAGRVASANEVAANTASPGFGVSLAGGAGAPVTTGGSANPSSATPARANGTAGPDRPGWTRADPRRIISRHVGNAHRAQARGIRMLRQPPAFDAGEMLTHRVDLDDRGAAGEQRARRCLLVRKRKASSGRDPVCRGAAGDEHQHQILRAGGIGEIERLDGRGKTGRVWQRVARLDDAHEAGRTAIAVTGAGETADAAFRHTMLVKIVAFGALGNGTRGLAGRQNDQASGGGRRQMRRQAALRVGGGHRRAEQPVEEGARRCGQGSNLGAAECPRRALVSRGPLRMGSTIIAPNSRTRRGMLDHPSCDRRTPGASLRAFTPVFDWL